MRAVKEKIAMMRTKALPLFRGLSTTTRGPTLLKNDPSVKSSCPQYEKAENPPHTLDNRAFFFYSAAVLVIMISQA